jgi:predicted transcriptional regulator
MTARLGRGELEARVMDALWSSSEWMTPADVRAVLKRRPALAYTTVMTILVRLWEKGMVERRREGRAYAYRPISSRDEWVALRMREMLDDAGNRAAALGHFVAEIDRAEVRQLRRLLDRDKSAR